MPLHVVQGAMPRAQNPRICRRSSASTPFAAAPTSSNYLITRATVSQFSDFADFNTASVT